MKTSIILCLMTCVAAISHVTQAANGSKQNAGNTIPVAKINTDAFIGSVDAMERTKLFPVGEKFAYFANIKDGDKVMSPFRVAFLVTGMSLSPAKAGNVEGAGHHHILIDTPFPADIKAPIPFDKADEFAHQHYKHLGKGENETVLHLPPGKHTLRLLFANHAHVPYYITSKEITIEVLPGK